MNDAIELRERDTEILETLVGLAGGDADWFFEIPVGTDRIASPPWPGSVQSPHREEIRSLVNQDLLEIDKSVAPTWRFWPSARARERFPDAVEMALKEALSDPDERLAVILKAIVDAFETDPSEPLLLLRTSSVDLVRHSGWAIPPDVVRHQDLSQLHELGLVGWESETEFLPDAGRTDGGEESGCPTQRTGRTDPGRGRALTTTCLGGEDPRRRNCRQCDQRGRRRRDQGPARVLTEPHVPLP